MNSFGNSQLLEQHKTAFLCSRKIPASTVLKCYDWATAQREAGKCVLIGAHSKIEKDVLHYLLKGKQSIIIALARGLKKKIEPEFIQPLKEGRLLIITPFDKKIVRVTEATAIERNEMMIEMADEVVVGFVSEEGNLKSVLSGSDKPIARLS